MFLLRLHSKASHFFRSAQISPKMSSDHEHAAAVQKLIEANLRLLFPRRQVEIVTCIDKQFTYACLVVMPGPHELRQEPRVLYKGRPEFGCGAEIWRALASVLVKTQELLGTYDIPHEPESDLTQEGTEE
ncbi:hypothetical protein EDB80DRAFT_738222 [Ilyonectria destructans]|nr:hypothetical protein EDB80DRAFT_738222 [Ilyonectria destructans]